MRERGGERQKEREHVIFLQNRSLLISCFFGPTCKFVFCPHKSQRSVPPQNQLHICSLNEKAAHTL